MVGGVKRLRLELEAIVKGQVDIVIGTQLVAKGHNFPNITCVGIIDADLGLQNGDPRASERTYQLLQQVTGRAGRTGKFSKGLLQTYQPDNPVIKSLLSGETEEFFKNEIKNRKTSVLPPFGRLAALVISSINQQQAFIHAKALRKAVPNSISISTYGPAEAPIHLVRGRYRYRLLIHAIRKADIQAYIRRMISDAPKPRGSIRVNIDIDPQNFM